MNTYQSVKNRCTGTSNNNSFKWNEAIQEMYGLGTGHIKPIKNVNGRKLKADWVNDIQELLPQSVSGLDKLTVKSLTELYGALKECL